MHALRAWLDPRQPSGIQMSHLAVFTLLVVLATMAITIPASSWTTHRLDGQYYATHYVNPQPVPTKKVVVPIMPEVSLLPASAIIPQSTRYPTPENQGPTGSCAAWASSQVATYLFRIAHPKSGLRFSARQQYDAFADTYSNGKDNGSDPLFNLQIANTIGLLQERALPYGYTWTDAAGVAHGAWGIDNPTPATDALHRITAQDAARHKLNISVSRLEDGAGGINGGQGLVDAIKSAVVNGTPPMVGLPVWPEYDNAGVWNGALIGLPTAAEVQAQPQGRGGHENVVLGYNDAIQMPDGTAGAFLVQNNWGKGWGVNGRAWISYAFAARYFFGVEVATLGNPTLAYQAPASVLRLSGVRTVISSSYWWENGIVGGLAAQDSDYMLGWGVQEYVRLPGTSSDVYHLYAVNNISGSGYYVTVTAPNGGRIAFMHLTWTSVAGTMRGGRVIGLSGWPTDPVYGNGTAGPGNAHLCIVTDLGGGYWLYTVTFRPAPRPKPKARPFHHRIYEQYRREHHKHRLPYKDSHGHLKPWAKWWNHHAPGHKGGILHRTHFFQPKHGFRYSKTSMQGGAIFCWSHYRTCTWKRWKHWNK